MSPIPAKTRTQVLERDGHSCLRCGHSVEHQPYSLHHRRGRRPLPGMPDPHTPENLVTLCGHATSPDGCHQWAHANPKAAYASGWMIHRAGVQPPAEVPVVDLMGHAWLLTATTLLPSSATTAPGGADLVAFPGGPVRGNAGHPSTSHPSKEIPA